MQVDATKVAAHAYLGAWAVCDACLSADAASGDAAAVSSNETTLVGLLDEAEQQLSKTQFLAGQAYSVADVTFTPVLFRLGMGGKTAYYLKPRPNVSEYYNRCATCIAWQVWDTAQPHAVTR